VAKEVLVCRTGSLQVLLMVESAAAAAAAAVVVVVVVVVVVLQDYEQFKELMRCVFPRILDTKYMASSDPFRVTKS